jgi:hypothetical protein
MRTSGSKAALARKHLLVSLFDSEVRTSVPPMLMNFGIGTLGRKLVKANVKSKSSTKTYIC